MNPQHMVVEVLQHSALLPETTVEQGLFVEQPLHPTENSQLPSEHKHSTLFDTSGDLGHHATQACVSACFPSYFRTSLLGFGNQNRVGT
jgi:hypothetical protein